MWCVGAFANSGIALANDTLATGLVCCWHRVFNGIYRRQYMYVPQTNSTDLELERVLIRPRVHSEAGLWVRCQIFWPCVHWPDHLCLVQDLVHLENGSLSLRSVWPDGCHQSRSCFALELHHDAANICRIGHPQVHPSLDNIEVRVVLVRVIEAYRDNHRRYWHARCIGCAAVCVCAAGAGGALGIWVVSRRKG